MQVETRDNNPAFKDMSRTWRHLEGFIETHSIDPEKVEVAALYDFVIYMLRISRR